MAGELGWLECRPASKALPIKNSSHQSLSHAIVNLYVSTGDFADACSLSNRIQETIHLYQRKFQVGVYIRQFVVHQNYVSLSLLGSNFTFALLSTLSSARAFGTTHQ